MMQGSRHLRWLSHPGSEKGTEMLAQGTTLALESYEEASVLALGWKDIICRK